MSTEYPFPLSASTVERLKHCFPFDHEKLISRLDLVPSDRNPEEPHLLEAFMWWHVDMEMRVRLLNETMGDLWANASSDDYIVRLYERLEIVRASIEQEVDRFENLLAWARTTWEDDPIFRVSRPEKEPMATT